MPKLGSRPPEEISALREVRQQLKQLKLMSEMIAGIQSEEKSTVKLMINGQKYPLSEKNSEVILKMLLTDRKEKSSHILSISKKYRLELTEADRAVMSGKSKQKELVDAEPEPPAPEEQIEFAGSEEETASAEHSAPFVSPFTNGLSTAWK